MYIFICDAWQPFPYSEYGGVSIVIAEDRGHCMDIILRRVSSFESEEYGDSLKTMVERTVTDAKMYPLTGSYAPGVVYEFIT